MKIRNIFTTVALSLSLGIGAIAGLSIKNNKAVEETKAYNTYYLTGTMNGWDNTDDSYPIKDDGSYSFVVIDGSVDTYEFKITTTLGSWDNMLGYSDVSSSSGAYDRFYGNGTNITCYVGKGDSWDDSWKRGVYGVKIVEGSIYIEIAWEYSGSDSSKGTVWTGSDTHYLVDGGPSVTWSFTDGEAFKLTDRLDAWGNEYNASLQGSVMTGDDASSLFTGGSGSNIVCHSDGDYVLTLSSGTLYVDFADDFVLYYNGSDASKAGTAWTNWDDADHLILINGGPVEFSFSADETFGLRADNAGWFGSNYVSDYYYNCFDASDTNIYVKMTYASYTVEAKVANHGLSIILSATNQNSNRAYVLDLNGNLLETTHNAHYFHYDSDLNLTSGTAWPGVEMSLTEDTQNIYQFDYWDVFDKAVINNGETGTYDEILTGHEDMCLILSWAYDGDAGKWSSMTWVSLDAAKFIDSFMKFETAHENDGGSGLCKTQNWYKNASDAYDDLSKAVKKEISGYSLVADRLAAWARANGGSFNVDSEGVGSFSSIIITPSEVNNNEEMVVIIVTAALALLSLTTCVIIKKKRSSYR